MRVSNNKIILGTVQFGLDYGINNPGGKLSPIEVERILNYAQVSGITTLDTAAAYGDSEERIGSYHENHPLFKIITKFDRVAGTAWKSSLHSSLDKLKVQSLETIMFHSYDSYLQVRQVLKDILRWGKGTYFNALGVSVYTNHELKALMDEEYIEVIQLPFNLLDNENQRGKMLRELKEKGKTIHVRSVFLQGLFYKDLGQLPSNLSPLKPYLQKIHQIAEEGNREIGALALQYAHSKPYIDGVIIGVDNKDHLEKNIQALNHEISKDLFKKIDKIKVNQPQLLNPTLWSE